MISDSGYLDAVHRQALRDPAAVAFELAGERSIVLTYGGLIERVVRLGERLRGAGHGSGNRVAICFENRPAWPVAYLATWYAGGVTVPLDPALDEQVIGRLLRHCGAHACLTSAAMAAKLRAACASLPDPPVLLFVEPPDPVPSPPSDPVPSAPPAPEASAPPPPGGWTWDGTPAERDGSPRQGPRLLRADGAPAGRDNETTWDAFAGALGAAAGADWNPAESDADDLGSIMYTSGTTGDPKGVMIRRGAVLENLQGGVERVRFTESDRILGVLPLFHVLPLVTNCLGPLYLGARVVFLSELTADAILAAFRRHEITVFVCVPAFFYRFHDRLLAGLEAASPARRRLASLLLATSRALRRHLGWSVGRTLLRQAHSPFGPQMRLFVTGGAKMNADVIDSFLDWGFALAQGYGLTEATAILTATPLDELCGDAVGRPIRGVDLRIESPDADGVGEIWATGPSLMQGYYRNPEATAEVLVDGWLRTGDLGRLSETGQLQITGRAKDVIVLASGKNIYPDELEGYYSQSELVEELCILGVPDDRGRGEQLHAVVVPDREAARKRGYVNVREMIKWDLETMGAKLPGPQRLTSLEIRAQPLPRTPTRKIKRFVLIEEIVAAAGERANQEAAPTTIAPGIPVPGLGTGATGDEVVNRALDVVRRHARRDTIRREDHLDLDLGLESLDRIELLSDLRAATGARLDADVVGAIHTVGELLTAIEVDLAKGARPEAFDGDGAAGRDVDADDHWGALLAQPPPGIEQYLARRPPATLLIWAVLRTIRLLWSLAAGYRVAGLEHLPQRFPFLVCGNHASYADPFFVCMGLPRCVLDRVFFVGYSEYFEGWFGRRFGRLVRNVPIDPNRNLERAMQAAAEGLRRGMVLVIFPEGARSLDGRVADFRRGAEVLARHLGAPLVPVGVRGAHEAWPRGGKLRRHPIALSFGAPIDAAASAGRPFGELTEELRNRVVRLAGSE